jgi:K+-sensing histidine kinase KdpD
LFQRYYRANSRRTTEEGIGLELNITKLLVEARGGRVWVDKSASLSHSLISCLFFELIAEFIKTVLLKVLSVNDAGYLAYSTDIER